MADANVIEVVIRARDEATQALRGFEKNIGSVAGVLTAASAAAVGMTTAAVAIANATAQAADEAIGMSRATGLSVEEVSRLGFAARQSETDIGAVASGMRFLQRAQADASQGNEQTIATFQRLGISMNDLNRVNAREALLRVADGLQRVESPAERTQIRLELLGRSGNQLASFLAGGREEIERMEQESDRLGATLSTSTAVAADRFGDQMQAMRETLTGVRNEIAAALLPVLTDYTAELTEGAAAAGAWVRENRAMIAAAGQTAIQFAPLLVTLSSLVALFGGVRIAAAALGVTLGGPVVIAISAVLGALGLVSFRLNQLREEAREPMRVRVEFTTNLQETKGQIILFENQIRLVEAQIAEVERRERARRERGTGTSPAPTLSDQDAAAQARVQRTSDVDQRVIETTGKSARETQKSVADLRVELEGYKTSLNHLRAIEQAQQPFSGTTETVNTLTLKTEEAQRAHAAFVAGLQGTPLEVAITAKFDSEQGQREIEAWYQGAQAIARDPITLQIRISEVGTENLEAAQRALREAARGAEELPGPFEETNPALVDFLRLSGLSEKQIESMGATFRIMGQQGSAALEGVAAGIAALGAQIETGFLKPSLVVAQSVYDAFAGAAAGIGDLFASTYVAILKGGEDSANALKSFFSNLLDVVLNIFQQILSAIIQAKVLEKTLAGIKGGGSLFGIFGSILGSLFSEGGVVGEKRGGAFGVTAAGALLMAATGGVIPGMVGGGSIPGPASRTDTVLTMLAKGETILPTIAGRAPDVLLGQVADQAQSVQRLVDRVEKRGGGSTRRGGGAGSFTQNVYLSSLGPQTFREEIRHGNMRDEWERAAELGRISAGGA